MRAEILCIDFTVPNMIFKQYILNELVNTIAKFL